MRTKIVYILISRQSSTDYYCEQAALSMYSLLKHNPDANITVVCDRETSELIGARKEVFSSLKFETIINDFEPEVDLRTRSRILKTTLRSIISGDFLFIDTDTIIFGSLEELDAVQADISMVTDCNRLTPIKRGDDRDIIDRCAMITERSVIGAPYFNSGVILAKDSAAAHQFYQRWNDNRQKSRNKGLFVDQPSLCVTNIELSEPINTLDTRWNCQFKYGASIKDVLILHYFNPFDGKLTGESPFVFLLYDKIRVNGFDSEYINKLLESPETMSTILNIKKESFGQYCTSPMVNLWFSSPKVFKFIQSIAIFLNRLKQLV